MKCNLSMKNECQGYITGNYRDLHNDSSWRLIKLDFDVHTSKAFQCVYGRI